MSLKRSASVSEGPPQPMMDEQTTSNLQQITKSSASTAPSKAQAKPEDFTRTVRKRLANTTRTGQACDRCKIRKIRCDGLAGGCSPCRQNSTECRTTDRISHRAVPRGYIEQLEQKCAEYEAKLKDMEALLGPDAVGSPRKQSHDDGSSTGGSSAGWNGFSDGRDNWGDSEVKTEHRTIPFSVGYSLEPSEPPRATGTKAVTRISPNRLERDPNGRPAFLIRKFGTQHVGMDSSPYMNSTRASALSVLGISIDLANLQGVAEPARTQNYIPVNSAMEFEDPNPLDDSLQSFHMTFSQHVPASVKHLSLPSKEEALMLVEWNFAATHPYLPILHKPTFMAELHRMYDIKNYRTSPAQLVIVHMTLAMSLYFIAKRRLDPGSDRMSDLSRSYRHYHYSLSFLPLLLAGGTLEDCQALICILVYTRGFTRPGPAYLLSKMTMGAVFELGLQRSFKKQHERAGTTMNVLEDEMRRRAFWTAFAISSGIASKLNRPITMRLTDFDTEYPTKIEDEFITEAGFTQDPLGPDQKCSFDCAFGLLECAKFSVEIHTKLYCAKKPSPKEYQAIVENLEAQMTAWKDGLPSHLVYNPSETDPMIRMQAANLMLWYNEFRILLRHPSLGLSRSPSLSSDNLKVCVEAARTILEISDVLRRENNLDTAWYATGVQLLASMTLLFAIWEKRETVTQNEIARVKEDMDLTVSVMKDWGKISGADNNLGDIIVSLTEGTMKMLRERHGQKAAPQPQPPAKRASVSARTYVPPNGHDQIHQHAHPLPLPLPQTSLPHTQTQQPQPQHSLPPPLASQQQALPQITQTQKQYSYAQSQPDQIHNPQNSIYVEPNVNTVPQMNHVNLHGTNYSNNVNHAQIAQDSVHNAAAALAAAAAQQQQQQPPHQPQYMFPHTTTAESGYWYGGGDNWKEYLTQMTSLAGDSGGFPAMALMSLGQPGRDIDGQWGFMNIYDYGVGERNEM